MPLFSQENSHNNIWSRVSISYPFSSKIKTEAEFQKRFQNDITQNNSENPFKEDLMNSVRFWFQYKINNKFNLSISPFAYFQNTSIISNQLDKEKTKSYELRYSIASDFKQNILPKTYFIERLALEYRDIINSNNNVIRIRNKTMFKYEFNSRISIIVFDEYFANLNSKDNKHIFDQNRIGITGNYNLSKYIRIELGYIYISRLLKTKEELMYDNNFLIMAYYTFNQNKK